MKPASPLSSGTRWSLPACLLILSITGLLLAQCVFQPFLQTPATIGGETITAEIQVTREQTPNTPIPVSSNQLVLWLPPWLGNEAVSPVVPSLENIILEFESNHPGVDVTTRLKDITGPFGALNSLILANEVAQGALPSLVVLTRQDMERAVIENILRPMDSLPADVLSGNWYSYAMSLSQIDGILYCLPLAGELYVFMSRSDLITPVASLDSLVQTRVPWLFADEEADPWLLLDIYLAAGGGLVDSAGNPVLDVAPLTQALRVFASGMQTGVFTSQPNGYSQNSSVWNAFASGESLWMSGWIDQETPQLRSNWRVDFLPGFESPMPMLADAWMWCLTDPDPNRAILAQALAEDLVSNINYVQGSTLVPVRSGTLSAWQDADHQRQIEPLLQAASPIPSVAVWDVIQPLLRQALNQVLFEQADPAATAESAVGQIVTP